MRWGVRSAKKAYAKATIKGDQDKIKKLDSKMETHRLKAVNATKKLEKEHPRLEKDVERSKQRYDVKAANLEAEAARYKRKSTGFLVSDRKAKEYLEEAEYLKIRADELRSRSSAAKARLEGNEDMQRTFKKGINEIDKLMADKGKQYIEYGATIKKAKEDYKSGKITRRDRRYEVRNAKLDRKNYLNAI